ncbi:MAG TPA: T9SS type A sorting domain-containing protein [Bacteroidia bacterium]|nr:T9SS type A sorting domain-containing protein [Bacteroidia bacterium]
MKKIITLVLFLLSTGNCFAQQIIFQKTFGGNDNDQGRSVQQVPGGGYIIAGSTTSYGAGDEDVYLIRVDQYGNPLWSKTFGGTGPDWVGFVKQTSDGGFIICSSTSFVANNNNVYLIKTDSSGNLLWSKTYGGASPDAGYDVQQTTDGGYIISGVTQSFGGGIEDVFLIRTDSGGNLLWSKTFGDIGYQLGYAVRQTSDGGFIIAGAISTFTTDWDIYLIKTDSNGNMLWTKVIDIIDGDVANAIRQTTDGGYIIAGWTESFGAGQGDFYLIKTDISGNILWTKTYGGPNTEFAYSVEQTTDGGYIVAGSTLSFGAGGFDYYLVKTDTIGNMQWAKTYGGSGDEFCYAVKQTADNGFILAGSVLSFGAVNNDIYFIKTDSFGNSGCNENTTATIDSVPATVITNVTPIMTSPPTVVTTFATIVGSGGTDTALCITVGIPSAIPNPQSKMSISPNPTANNFTITFPNTINKGSIEIYNVMGKKIFAENIADVSQKEIHLKNTAAGIYFVKVSDGKKEYCEKLVVE